MVNHEKFVQIAEALNRQDWKNNLLDISSKIKGEKPIYLPLVGEFSSGKTSLINSLTDGKVLETSTVPTTSTIYKVFFGCDSVRAEIISLSSDECVEEVSDFSKLKNESLKDSLVVNLYDTSNKVPNSIVLVDTPGLSSRDFKHKETLINFLPKSDAILLVTDINQQLTKSLTDFIADVEKSNRPIYLIVTKCDTKSKDEIESVRKEIVRNGKLKVEDIAFVSSLENNIEELNNLFNKIEKNRNVILEKSVTYSYKVLSQEMLAFIDDLIKNSSTDRDIKTQLEDSKRELDRIKRELEMFISSASNDVSSIANTICRDYEERMKVKLEQVVTSKSSDYNMAVYEAVTSNASTYTNLYKEEVKKLLRAKSQSNRLHNYGVSLELLSEQDWSNLEIETLTHSVDLNSVGHQYDTAIKWTGYVAAAVVAGAVMIKGGILSGVKAMTKGGAVSAIADVADTASDVGSMVSNSRNVTRIQKIVEASQTYAPMVIEKAQELEKKDKEYAEKHGVSGGFANTLVSKLTDSFLGKPQRVRAISEYIDYELMPNFSKSLDFVTTQMMTGVSNYIMNEAEQVMNTKIALIKEYEEKFNNDRKAYDEKINELKQYKNYLLEN